MSRRDVKIEYPVKSLSPNRYLCPPHILGQSKIVQTPSDRLCRPIAEGPYPLGAVEVHFMGSSELSDPSRSIPYPLCLLRWSGLTAWRRWPCRIKQKTLGSVALAPPYDNIETVLNNTGTSKHPAHRRLHRPDMIMGSTLRVLLPARSSQKLECQGPKQLYWVRAGEIGPVCNNFSQDTSGVVRQFRMLLCPRYTLPPTRYNQDAQSNTDCNIRRYLCTTR